MRRTAPFLAVALLATATAARPAGAGIQLRRNPPAPNTHTAALEADQGAQSAAQRRHRRRSDRARPGAGARPDPAGARAAVRHADPDQGQYRDERARCRPRPGSLALADNVTDRDAPLVARLRAGRRGDRRQGQPVRMGEHPRRAIRSRAGARSAARPATRTRSTATAADRARAAASAVAAGMVPAAIGTETDGSITCPAAINGIVGFKPTVGLVSRTHVVPISHSQDTPGPMTRTVRDAALVLNAIAGSDPADPATGEADARRVDYAAGSRRDALARRADRRDALRQRLRHRRAVRGGAADPAGAGRDAGRDQRSSTRRPEIGRKRVQGAARRAQGRPERLSRHHCRRASGPARWPTSSPSTRAHADASWPCSARTLFEQAEETKGLDDPDYRKARETSLRLAGARGHRPDAARATMSSPWSARPCLRPG